MKNIKNTRVALAQFKPKLSKSNLEKHLDILENTTDVDLIVFPELSLNGYLLQDKVFEDAWDLDELSKIAKHSIKFDIVVGAVIRERKEFFNSSLYFSKGKLLHHHKKLHLPNYGLFEEARFFQSGKDIDFIETSFGRVVTLICEDIWKGSTLAKLEIIQPDLLIIISNSPARGFSNGKIEIVEQWKAILKTASIFSKSKTIFVNRVGFEDGLGFWGGSMTFDKKGNITNELKLYDEVVEIVNI